MSLFLASELPFSKQILGESKNGGWTVSTCTGKATNDGLKTFETAAENEAEEATPHVMG